MLIWMATLGQRPEAVTIALDKLSEHYVYDQAVILLTDPQVSGIATSYQTLKTVWERGYSHLPVDWHIITYTNGAPLLDIDSQAAAQTYFEGVIACISAYRT